MPSFDDVAAFVREVVRPRGDRSITPETRLEADLGVTGDDGTDLLREAEKRFKVTLTRNSFGLGPNECLFGPEGFDPLGIIHWIRGLPRLMIRDLTVGELHDAVCRAAEWQDKGAV